ncbi:hypothetical protein G6O69_07315 [Pseudenhygromyxa sp. WMMC2535]|uniref:hypothetical protein n=1 Tax=Pseudenhygromyxa sp. WMMC2535 TaxID=2712867 RepID=UPI0015517C1B|nr:hypothetical protein [Pseudenhygromyxa sp. WMMC2535]NVB37636.1 hypothetical protein [Pseudenhygromyxa sp. WMMC2535]
MPELHPEPELEDGLDDPVGVEEQTRELVAGRLAQLREGGVELDALAPFFARVRAQLPEQADALASWAAACDLPAHALLALDGGVVETLVGGEHERGLSLYVAGPDGPVLAGAWQLEPAFAEHIELRALDHGGWRLAVPGSLGLAGVTRGGAALTSLHLRPAAPGPGLPGSAVLDALLAADSLAAARASIETLDLVDGRCWMLADGHTFLGFEHLGGARILTRVGPKTGHVHVNHCFDPSLRQREARPRSPESFRRLELASTLYVQRRPETLAGVLDFFDAVEEAAFASAPRRRAETLFAVELASGRACLRRRAGDPLEWIRFPALEPPP